jgi:hypothetical protein
MRQDRIDSYTRRINHLYPEVSFDQALRDTNEILCEVLRELANERGDKYRFDDLIRASRKPIERWWGHS